MALRCTLGVGISSWSIMSRSMVKWDYDYYSSVTDMVLLQVDEYGC